MSLKDHTIDSSKISEEQIENIITGNVKYDPARKTVVLLPNTRSFSNEKRVLLYLTALLGWPFVTDEDVPEGAASPQEVSKRTNVPGGSVRPLLGALTEKQIIGKQQGKYFLPSHNLGLVQEALSTDGVGLSTSFVKGSKKSKPAKPSKSNQKNSNSKTKAKPSLADSFSKLLDENWFNGGKTTSQLKDKLDEMTVFPPMTQLPHYLLKSCRAGILERKKEEVGDKKVWVYYQK